MVSDLPPAAYLDMSHNDEMDMDGDRHERIRRRASLMNPLLDEHGGSSGFKWLAVGHAINEAPTFTLRKPTRPASPLIRPSSPSVLVAALPAEVDVPELVPSYANSAPSEEEDFELEDRTPYADPDLFPLGDHLHPLGEHALPSPGASLLLLERGTYKPDAALIDVADDPFAELRESVRVMSGEAKEQAEDELRAHEVHEDMTARLHEAMW